MKSAPYDSLLCRHKRNLHSGVADQFRDCDARACRWIALEIAPIDLIHLAIVLDISKVYLGFNNIGKIHATCFQSLAQAVHHLFHLSFDAALSKASLPRWEQH